MLVIMIMFIFQDTYQHYMVTCLDDGTTSGTSHFIRVGDGSIDLVQIIDGGTY